VIYSGIAYAKSEFVVRKILKNLQQS